MACVLIKPSAIMMTKKISWLTMTTPMMTRRWIFVKISWLTGRTFQVKQRKAKTTGTLRANKVRGSTVNIRNKSAEYHICTIQYAVYNIVNYTINYTVIYRI